MILNNASASQADVRQQSHPVVRLPPTVHQYRPDSELAIRAQQYSPLNRRGGHAPGNSLSNSMLRGSLPPSMHYSHHGPLPMTDANSDNASWSPGSQHHNAAGTYQPPFHQQLLDRNAFVRGGRVATSFSQPNQPPRQIFNPNAHHPPFSNLLPDAGLRQTQYLEQVATREISAATMSQAEREEKEAFRATLERVIHEVCHNCAEHLPNVFLECFGSFKSGFATAGSDMDLVIVLQDSTHSPACFSLLEDDLPRALEKRLLQLGYGARLLTQTRVPIIKICELPNTELLEKLRQERERWDALPDEKKYPHLYPDNDGEDAAGGSARNAQGAETKAKDVEPVAEVTTHACATNGPQKVDIEDSKIKSPVSHTKDARSSTEIVPVASSEGEQKQLRKRDEKPFTRERKAGPLDFPKSGVGIQCDINFFNPLGLHNTQLLRCYSLCDSRVQPMVLFVKAWASRRKINSSYSGTLSSYGYVLMVLHYLINIAQPPVLPNLQAQWRPYRECTPAGGDRIEVDGWTVDFWRRENEIMHAVHNRRMSSNKESLGSLLSGFFQYFSSQNGPPQFYWTQEVLSLRSDGGILKKEAKGWVKAVTEAGEGKKVQHRYLFCIEDPFELSHNVARTVTHNGIVAIRDEFRRANRILRAIGSGERPRDGELFAELIEAGDFENATTALRVDGSMGHLRLDANGNVINMKDSNRGVLPQERVKSPPGSYQNHPPGLLPQYDGHGNFSDSRASNSRQAALRRPIALDVSDNAAFPALGAAVYRQNKHDVTTCENEHGKGTIADRAQSLPHGPKKKNKYKNKKEPSETKAEAAVTGEDETVVKHGVN